ncbi:putative cwf18 pre-mrna splicing factor protein [Eutypa lata UCREL1]|uniref:Putative cwf18 pre-mrna splicing factor protein n=1 Tax=Eutypa lata (strain UCR-EL1) TaxID=1287681 RepID=M7S895_EUTLA|nr:putative cwf18 pre-mrna splicing factor protein [Eutypa lata UCREL1]
MSTSRATLSAASDDRKARLAKLKTLKRKQPGDEIVAPESERSGSLPAAAAEDEPEATALISTTQDIAGPVIVDEEEKEEEEIDVARLHLSGRNYDAEAKGPKLGFEAPPTLGLDKQTLEAQAAGVEAEVRQRAARDAADDAGIDLFKLQPRKPNWDLKRDLDKKLEVLGVRTDNAIARLVRERIAGAQQKATAKNSSSSGDRDGDAAGMDGVSLVEGVRVREREEEEDERRERREEENDLL